MPFLSQTCLHTILVIALAPDYDYSITRNLFCGLKCDCKTGKFDSLPNFLAVGYKFVHKLGFIFSIMYSDVTYIMHSRDDLKT